MESQEIIRTLHGLIKKHGDNFSVKIKYLTENDKIKKRHGRFVALSDGQELTLHNQEKKTLGHYALDRILELGKL